MSGERAASKATKAVGPVLGGVPRADLLPPEVHQRGKAAAVKRMLGMLIVLALLVVGGAYAAASFYANGAQAQLLAAQARTDELLQEQLEYADVTRVTTLLNGSTEARAIGTAGEVVWADALETVRTYFPAGTVYTAIAASSNSAWAAPLVPNGPLRQPRIGTISITIISPLVFDATAVARRLVEVEGYADATIDLVEVLATGQCKATMTLNLGDGALAHRFDGLGEDEVTE